jgi:uncharacterized protein (DUF2384 family)
MAGTMSKPAAADRTRFKSLQKKLVEEQDRLSDLLRKVENTLASLSIEESAWRKREFVAQPAPSALDAVHELIKATEDLRGPNGNLSSKAIAEAFGVSMNQLATWVRRSRQALAKTPDADSLQDQLAFFERIARLRVVMPQDRFLKWLRMPHHQLDHKSPIDLIAGGEQQIVVDFVEDMLTGAPS